MMSSAEERALLAEITRRFEVELDAAFAELLALIRSGLDPREAVDRVMQSFTGEFTAELVAGFTAILGDAVGTADVLDIRIGVVRLSQRLYAESQIAGAVVRQIVQRHVRGFQDARALALELFEGYGFRAPDAEVLRMSPSNPALPQYMRQALLPDLGDGLARAYARLHVDRLSTSALQAAYRGVLDALDRLEAKAGAALLEKRLHVAFFERMRFFASRIARTELHRAYAEAEAARLMEDEDLEYVQIRRGSREPRKPCICALLAGRDLYKLGAGVYPKAVAPMPPFHPFCQCVQAPRLDLTGRRAAERDEDGDAYFLRRIDAPIAARIMGSRAKRDSVLGGTSAETVANAGRDPLYRIKTAGEVAPAGVPQ